MTKCPHCNRDGCPCFTPEDYSGAKTRCRIGEVRYHPGKHFNTFCNGEEDTTEF